MIATVGPFRARPPTTGETARTRSRRRWGPSRAQMGSMLSSGLEGPITTRSAPLTAPTAAGAGTACSRPSKRSPRTGGSQRLLTNHSWKLSSPASVATRVRTGSSLMGMTATCSRRRRPISAVAWLRLAPRLRRVERRRWRPRSRSPSPNQVGSPSCPSISRAWKLSSRTPKPESSLNRPARRYRTASVSGQTSSPHITSSSAVLVITLSSPGARTRAKPQDSRAAPVPPARIVTRMGSPEEVHVGGADQLPPAARGPLQVQPADDDGGDPLGLAHDQLGRRGDLVGHRHHRGVEGHAEVVGASPVVDRCRYPGHAQGDVAEPDPPGAAEGVADHHPHIRPHDLCD